MSRPVIGSTLAAVIRMWNRRATAGLLLYCHASQLIQGTCGRSRNRPAKCARNDESGGRPATPMKLRYRAATSGSAARSASVTCAAGGLAGRPSAATATASPPETGPAPGRPNGFMPHLLPSLPAVPVSHPTARHGGRAEAMVLTLAGSSAAARARAGAARLTRRRRGSPAVFAEPSGEFAGPADRAEPALGLVARGGGGGDERAAAGVQGGGGRRDEPIAAADDEGDVGLGGQPQFEDLYAVQP